MRTRTLVSKFLAISVVHAAALIAMPAWGDSTKPEPSDRYPSRTITMIVPYSAGSSTDLFGRILAEALSEELGQPVVVLNTSGAGGTLGLRQMLKAPPDGYTLGVVTTSSIAINRGYYKDLPYDSLNDISIVGIPSSTPNVLVASSERKVKTIGDLISAARSDKYPRYNSMGNGTSQQLLSFLLSREANLKAEHIPYKGIDGIMGMLTGQTLFGFASIPSVASLVDAGRLTIIGSTGSKPSVRYPQVPTLLSLGYSGFEQGNSWYGIGVNVLTPKPIATRLATALSKVAQAAATQKRLETVGFEPAETMSQPERDEFVKHQVEFWGQLLTDWQGGSAVVPNAGVDR